MWEIWYTRKNTAHVAFRVQANEAVEDAVNMILNKLADFNALVSPNGAIRSNIVYERVRQEERRQREKEATDAGDYWVIEVKATHMDDFWAIAAQAATEEAANNKVANYSNQIGAERVRKRQLVAGP